MNCNEIKHNNPYSSRCNLPDVQPNSLAKQKHAIINTNISNNLYDPILNIYILELKLLYFSKVPLI